MLLSAVTIKEFGMSAAVILVLMACWLVGMVTNHTIGGLLHLLLFVGLVIFSVNIVTHRSANSRP